MPPIVSGDVPTAEKQTFELYSGFIYESEADSPRRSLPAVEMVYGLSDRQEINLQLSYLSLNGANGFGDVILGTKYNFIKESNALPGVSASYELTFPAGSKSRGLSAGEFDSEFLLRAQKSWGWYTVLANAGYAILPDAKIDGTLEKRKNAVFLSLVQEFEVTTKTKLFAEVYLETSEEPEKPNRFAGDIGFEQKLSDQFRFQASIGKSLREGNQGGPDVRIYAGFEWDFDAPWKRSEQKQGAKK